MFSLEDTLFNIWVDSLTLNSEPIALHLMLVEAYLRHFFFVRHITAFLYLRTLKTTSALRLGAIFSQITNKKHKTEECGIKHCEKGAYLWELMQGRASWCLTKAGNVCTGQLKFSATLHMCMSGISVNDNERYLLIWGLQIHCWQVSEVTNT